MGVLLHEDEFGAFTFKLNPVAIPGNSTVVQTFKVANIKPGDWVSLSAPNLDPTVTVLIGDAYCKTAGILSVRFINYAAGAITDPMLLGTVFNAFVFRAERIRSAATDA